MGGEGIGISDAEAAGMLGWWLEAGVDVAVQEEPRNWLRQDSVPVTTADPEPEPQQPLPETLELFRDWLATAETLPLARAGTRRVAPMGAKNAPIMLLADAPDSDDAAAGQPIGGKAWELAGRMLAAIGLSADGAYVANLSGFHAPGARLSPENLEACAAIARRHIGLANPQRLLLLGDAPARALLGKPLMAARGEVHTIEGVRTVVTFHPRWLIDRPADKALAWKDLQLLMEDKQ